MAHLPPAAEALGPEDLQRYASAPLDDIDFEVFYEVVLQLGAEGTRALLGTLGEDGQARLDRLSAAAAASDWAAVGKEAHALKSGAGTFGLRGVSARALALEMACRAGVGWEQLGAVEGLSGALAQGVAALRGRLG
jgi:HPt (histidine-containing phosphotransfer) domain-containing protein